MDEKLLEDITNINEALKSDKRIIHLNEIEKKMEENDEVKVLSFKKEEASIKYNDALRIFGEDKKETIEALKNLKEKVDDLNSHPLVKEYLKAYKEVNELIKEINDILFSNLKLDSLKKE